MPIPSEKARTESIVSSGLPWSESLPSSSTVWVWLCILSISFLALPFNSTWITQRILVSFFLPLLCVTSLEEVDMRFCFFEKKRWPVLPTSKGMYTIIFCFPRRWGEVNGRPSTTFFHKTWTWRMTLILWIFISPYNSCLLQRNSLTRLLHSQNHQLSSLNVCSPNNRWLFDQFLFQCLSLSDSSWKIEVELHILHRVCSCS